MNNQDKLLNQRRPYLYFSYHFKYLGLGKPTSSKVLREATAALQIIFSPFPVYCYARVYENYEFSAKSQRFGDYCRDLTTFLSF